MTTRIAATFLCATSFLATAVRAHDNPHHLEAKDIPEAWRNFKGDPYLYLPVPPDPPDAARGARLVSPSRNESEPIEIAVGDRVRLDPAALAEGWRIDSATSNLLEPVPGAPRVFLARCPGKAGISFTRGPVKPPPHPPIRGGFVDNHNVTLQIGDVTPPTPGCTEWDFMPRTPNPGRLTLLHSLQLIQMRMGEEVVLVPQGSCVEAWHHFTLSQPGVIARVGDTPEGIRLRAIGRGRIKLFAPMPSPLCSEPDDAAFNIAHDPSLLLPFYFEVR